MLAQKFILLKSGNAKMDINSKVEISNADEKNIVKWQYIVFFAAVLLFVPFSFLLMRMRQPLKYSALEPCLPLFYIGLSSIRNRVSIIRLRGQREYSRGTKAMVFGFIAFAIVIVNILIVFVPALSQKIFPPGFS